MTHLLIRWRIARNTGKMGVFPVHNTEGIEKFIRTAKQHVGVEKLDAYVLHELIQGIYVDAPDKSSGKRKQHIHIKCDGVEFIPLSMLRNEETA